MTWPLPDPAAGALPEPKPLVPEEFPEPEFTRGEPEEGAGAPGPADREPELGTGLDARLAGAGWPAAWAGPDRLTAKMPAAATLAAVTVVVTERILACP